MSLATDLFDGRPVDPNPFVKALAQAINDNLSLTPHKIPFTDEGVEFLRREMAHALDLFLAEQVRKRYDP